MLPDDAVQSIWKVVTMEGLEQKWRLALRSPPTKEGWYSCLLAGASSATASHLPEAVARAHIFPSGLKCDVIPEDPLTRDGQSISDFFPIEVMSYCCRRIAGRRQVGAKEGENMPDLDDKRGTANLRMNSAFGLRPDHTKLSCVPPTAHLNWLNCSTSCNARV
jgi:hypothetical protein